MGTEKNVSPVDTGSRKGSKSERRGSSTIVDQVGKCIINKMAKVDQDGPASIVVKVSEHQDAVCNPEKKISRGCSTSIEIRKNSAGSTRMNISKKVSISDTNEEKSSSGELAKAVNEQPVTKQTDAKPTDKKKNEDKQKKSSMSNTDSAAHRNATQVSDIESGNSKSLNLIKTIIPSKFEKIYQPSSDTPTNTQENITTAAEQQGKINQAKMIDQGKRSAVKSSIRNPLKPGTKVSPNPGEVRKVSFPDESQNNQKANDVTMESKKSTASDESMKTPSMALKVNKTQVAFNKTYSSAANEGAEEMRASVDKKNIQSKDDDKKEKKIVEDEMENDTVISDISSENSGEVSETEEDSTETEVETSWVYQPIACNSGNSVTDLEAVIPPEIPLAGVEDEWDMFSAMNRLVGR